MGRYDFQTKVLVVTRHTSLISLQVYVKPKINTLSAALHLSVGRKPIVNDSRFQPHTTILLKVVGRLDIYVAHTLEH